MSFSITTFWPFFMREGLPGPPSSVPKRVSVITIALHTKGAPGNDGQHLPIRLEFNDQREVVDRLMPELLLLVTDGMVEVQETTILKVAHSATREHR
jgi:hypothetical protein